MVRIAKVRIAMVRIARARIAIVGIAIVSIPIVVGLPACSRRSARATRGRQGR